MYQNTLDKSSKKFICPNCGKRTFVRFVETESGKYLAENFGRCDRESECRYYVHPVNEKMYYRAFKTPEIIPTSYISSEIMYKTENNYEENNFVKFLLKHFDVKQVGKVLEVYHIGTSKKWNGACVFWQIDNQNKIRTGKIMLYDKSNGKRIKEPYNHVNWSHKVLKIEDFNLKQCLFGLHRITVELNKPIAIVESEKTAIIMSLVSPDFVWMATGSKANLKEEFLKPLRNRKIILHPDYGEFEDWQKLVSKLKDKGYKIAISDLLEKMQLKKGYDLVDYYLAN
jgi:predicted RNA-binding Zn-ribbon protein involved in translation (DUF1610 family)